MVARAAWNGDPMRISTKGRYGTRAMVALAAAYEQGRMPAGRIAQEQAIPLKYLESLLSSLKAARLVHSRRGQGGGYRLTRPPAEINLAEVLAPLEDALVIVHCTEEGDRCRRSGRCCMQEVWKDIKQAVDSILCRTTLADLLRRQDELEKAP